MVFHQLFSSYSELHNSKVITYFFASGTLLDQFEYLLFQPTGYSFINGLLVSYPAKTHCLFFVSDHNARIDILKKTW